MKTNPIRTLAAAISFASVMLTSCQKETLTPTTDDATLSNQILVNQVYTDVQKIRVVAENFNTLSGKTDGALGACVVFTNDTVSVPHVMTMDFGAGCTADGMTRKGKVIITYDAPSNVVGSTAVTTFDNFYINNNQETGSITSHNDGLNVKNNFSFSVNGNIQVIMANNAGTIRSTSSGTIEWTAGSSTATNVSDDLYEQSGSSYGTLANGRSFTETIQTPVLLNLSPGCTRFPTSGVVLIQVAGSPDQTINYGSGACDNVALQTINGRSRTIILR